MFMESVIYHWNNFGYDYMTAYLFIGANLAFAFHYPIEESEGRKFLRIQAAALLGISLIWNVVHNISSGVADRMLGWIITNTLEIVIAYVIVRTVIWSIGPLRRPRQ